MLIRLSIKQPLRPSRVREGKAKPKERERKLKLTRSMSSKQRKKTAPKHKLQQLGAVTSSSAVNNASIIVDASEYIEDLKQKVEELNGELEIAESLTSEDQSPMVSVKILERGFLINVFSERNCPGMLVSILEAFEELGLDVLDARVSCEDTFHLQAVGGESQEYQYENIDAQVVKQAVLQAIKNIQ